MTDESDHRKLMADRVKVGEYPSAQFVWEIGEIVPAVCLRADAAD
jgi:hypothetical protein